MKVCILGCGYQGTGLAALLAQEEGIEELILGDRDIAFAESAVSKIKTLGDKIKKFELKAVEVDATDTNEIIKISKGSHIIFNAIMPFCNIPIMSACLQIKAHYLDLYGYPEKSTGVKDEETIDAQFDLNDEFKKVGIIGLPCTGLSPGWTTMTAKYVIDKFDTVEKVFIPWADGIDTQKLVTPVYPDVLFRHFLGPPYPNYYKDGKIEAIDLLESEELYDFPDPIGKRYVYAASGDADVILIPKYAGKKVDCVIQKGANYLGKMGSKDIWIKALSMQLSKHYKKETIDMFERLGSSFELLDDFSDAIKSGVVTGGAESCSVIVTGLINSVKTKYTLSIITDSEESIKHIPWAPPGVYGTIGTTPIELILMLKNDEIHKHGVISIMEIEKKEDILKRNKERGHRIFERIERDL